MSISSSSVLYFFLSNSLNSENVDNLNSIIAVYMYIESICIFRYQETNILGKAGKIDKLL
jgi:hypothetical protein